MLAPSVRSGPGPATGSTLCPPKTLNRMELGSSETARDQRYSKVTADEAKLTAALVDTCKDMHAPPYDVFKVRIPTKPSPMHRKKPASKDVMPPA